MYKKHFLQSPIWAQIRELQGWKHADIGGASLLIKPIVGKWSMGYMPQVDLSTLDYAKLQQVALENQLTHIHLDPQNVVGEYEIPRSIRHQFRISESEEIYYRHTTVLNLEISEDDLLSNMKPKTRYNLNLARKKGVSVTISDDDKDFEIFLKLFFDTVKRQNYFGRDEKYYQQIWNTLKPLGKVKIALSWYENKPLNAWMLFAHDGVIYYPYGGSSEENRDVMATYALVWGIVEWGKQNGFQWFDLWGTLGPNPVESSPQFGFHRFKVGFNGEMIEYLPAYHMVINVPMYYLFRIGNGLRWVFLRAKRLISK